MAKVRIENYTPIQHLGRPLLKAIRSTAIRLNADTVVINKARYNKWVEVELFEDGNAIDWHYNINI